MISSNRNLYFGILVLCLADVVYSFLQHYAVSLDGDLSLIVMPAEWYSRVLKDPVGLSVLLNNDYYAAPNRFFVHWIMEGYFKTVPLWLQNFMDPVDSIYAACAFAKLFIQVGLIIVLSLYITKLTRKRGIESFFLAAILITPLFQACGYNVMMGIIDKSITYTFFYAGALLVLLIFYLPFCTSDWNDKKKKFSWSTHLLLLVLSITLPFSGPLVPGVVLVVCPVSIAFFWCRNYKDQKINTFKDRFLFLVRMIPGRVLFYFALISFFSLWSLYVGTHNLENSWAGTIPVSERFSRLPVGIMNLLITKLGFPLILLMIGLNIFILRKYHKDDAEVKKVWIALAMVGLCAFIYILLLPLGGYRPYRPNILRRDTIMPVTLGLFFIYGWSSFYLIHYALPRVKKIYIAISILFGFAFTIADNPDFGGNKCERMQLEYLAKATEKNVLLRNDCVIMTWENKYEPRNAVVNNQLLQYWGILHEKKYYYQK